MKTFTTYAEKKAKQFLNLLQGYTKGIRMTAILILLLMGVNNAWADTAIRFSGGHIYFADTHDVHKGVTQLAARKSNCNNGDWYTAVTTLSNIENTKLYYTNTLEGSGWQNVCWNGWCLISNSSAKSNTNNELWNSTYSTWWSSYDSYDLDNNSTYIITVASNAQGAQKTTEYKSSGYSALNFQQAIKSVVNSTVANSKAPISITSYKMTGNGTATEQTATLGTGAKDSYVDAALTATTTLTVGDVETGYQFDGWYTAATGGTQLSKEKTYTYYPTAATTVYARFSTKQHTILFGKQGNGTITAKVGNTSISSNSKVNYGSKVVFTATPSTGYQIEGWYSNSTCTTPINNGTNSTYTVTITGGTNVYVKFVAQQYTITYKDQNNANFSGTHASGYPTTHTYGTATTLKTASKTGYTFEGWHTDAACNNKVTSLGATAYTANITLYAKWTATEKTHAVTISYKYDNTDIALSEQKTVGEVNVTSITAPTIAGYTFEKWTLGSGIVNKSDNTTDNPISITTNSSGSGYTLTANYTKNSYTLNFGVQGNIGGSATATVGGNAITSPETFEHGTQITLTATADDKYAFIQWVDGSGASLSTANPYTHTLTATTTIQAVFANTDVLYLKPIADWKQNNEWYAAYFYKEGTGDNFWVRMKNEDPCGGSAYYKTLIPDGDWTHVIFIRMDGSKTDLKWENKWDQTVDLTIPTDGKNCFTNGSKNNDKFTGSWSTHTPTNYEPVVFNVTVPAGTPNCYIIGDWDGWSQFTEMTKVDDTHYTVTIPDVCAKTNEYKYCYGPSWGCQEVKADFSKSDNRKHSANDVVSAWIKYCFVGYNGNWDWNAGYEFDINGDMDQHLATVKVHEFKIQSSINEYYTTDSQDGGKHNFHREHTSEKIPETNGDYHNLTLNVDMAGRYYFHFDPVSKLLTIQFPEKGYRLKITMTDGSKKVYTSNAVDDETEILSFFAPGSDDTELSGTIILEYQGGKKADIPSTSFKTSGVYKATLNSSKNGITNIEPYDGNYYIRTDGANGGWGNYKTDSDNKMTYFVPREEEKYSYYWVEALPRTPRNESNGVVNVKGCVANDYNDNLAVMLEADKFTSDAYGNVKIIDPDADHREKINVRFGYNPKTNHFERAMLTGSGNINTFLNIFDPLPEGYLYKTNNNGTLETQLTAASKDNKFTDISNWVYERDVWVDVKNDKDVTVCLTAVSYNGARNSLFGFDDKAQTIPTQRTIVGAGSTQGKKKMRVIYDFKTNRMIMAWMPDEYTCNKEEALIADVLFMRHENELVPQLTITDTDTTDQIIPQIRGIQSQFFALEFENNGENNREEQYWFTLPFNSIVGSISGVPGYMTVWGIQRYDGAERAQKGWFKETETFWKWLTPNDTLKAGEGYVLSFDKSKATWNTFDVHTENEDGSVTTTQRSLLRLYFPSIAKGFTFTGQDSIVEYANEPCTIQREDRYKQDGNWKIIGPISYNTARPDSTTYETSKDSVWHPKNYTWSRPMFRYSYWRNPDNRDDWKYTPEDGEKAVYNAFFGYMVQFAGFINWSEISQSIHPRLRARTYTDQVPTNITTNLELLDAEDVQQDQTFVALNIEGTTTYDLNKDLNKVFNKNFANIYTLSEGIPFAGNTLPMEKAIVPVGVRIATAGEYTFRMPDGTEGISVTLVDNATGTHTNMLLDKYTVTLDAGTIENRFYIVVDPDRAATSVENVGEEANGNEAKGIEKFLIDGQLIIRTTDGIFDAKGQRL